MAEKFDEEVLICMNILRSIGIGGWDASLRSMILEVIERWRTGAPFPVPKNLSGKRDV